MASTLSVGVSLCLVLAARAVNLRVDADKDLVTAKLHQQEDNCACVPWNEVYSVHGVKCGSGYEFGIYGSNQWFQPDAWENALKLNNQPIFVGTCNMTYMAMPYTTCFNIEFGTPANPSKQWCYVNKECKWANPVSDTLGVKWCNEAADSMASNLLPEQLEKMAQKRAGRSFGKMLGEASLDLNRLASLSYPTARSTLDKTGACDGRAASDTAASELKDIMASKVPTYIKFEDDLEPGVVVVGDKVYSKADGPQGRKLEGCPNCPNNLPVWNQTTMCDVMARHKDKEEAEIKLQEAWEKEPGS